MDTNEYGPAGEYGQQADNIQMPPPVDGGQGGYGYGGGMPPNDFGGQGKPPRQRGRGLFFAAIILVCLFAGGIITAYVVMPAFDLVGLRMELSAAEDEDQPSLFDVGDGEAESSDETAALPDQMSDVPEIGGETPVISASDSPIVQIVKAVSPSVVVIRIDDPSMPDELDSQGTGIIIADDGHIVTNSHVIKDRGDYDIIVETSEGAEYIAEVVGGDEATDLAVIKIDATGLAAAALGDSDILQIGEEVVVIGNALGLGADTTTTGIISGLNKEVNNENGYTQEYIQTDAAINPGNSGGPLVNTSGEVIGINTLKQFVAEYYYGQEITAEGIGFAIPINTAIPIIQQLMTEGKVERPGIGISCLVDTADYYNPNTAPDGVTIADITMDGPADKVGLQPADIITAADGKEVLTVEELTEIIKSHDIGEMMDITIWREGTYIEKVVRIGDLNNMG